MVVLVALGVEEALGEVVAEALTEEEGEGEEEVTDEEEEVWIEMEAMAGMGEAWVEPDLAIPDLVTGSVNRQPVETQTLPGGRNATSARRRKGRILETQVKEEDLVEEGEEEDTVVAVGVDLVEAGVEDLGTEVDAVVASGETGEVAVDMEVASEVTEGVVAEALVVEEAEVLVGIGVEGEVVSVTVVVGVEGSAVTGVVAL